jgi:hypothetical protein
MLGQLRLADQAIAESTRRNVGVNGLPNPFNWKAFFDGYDNAKSCLRELLNPKSFRSYLNNI